MMQRKIKIIYDVYPDIVGGAEIFIFDLIKYIDRDKFEPVICVRHRGRALGRFRRLNAEITVIDIYGRGGLDRLAYYLKEAKVDIAQSNYFNLALAMAASMAGIPHIWRLQVAARVAFPDLSFKEREKLMSVGSMLSDRLILPSQYLKDQLKDTKHSKAEVIPNAVDISQIDRRQKDSGLLKKYACGKGCLAVGMAAHLRPQKRQIDFILAAKKVKEHIKDAKYFIIGSAYPCEESMRYAEYLHKAVKDAHMHNDIIFAGFCKDRIGAIKAMDLIVLPSLDEGFGMAVIEAMASAKPVIGADSGALKEIIKDALTGYLVPPRDPRSLAKAMIDILRNPQRAGKMGEAGRRNARKCFNIDKCVDRHEKVYRQVCKGG